MVYKKTQTFFEYFSPYQLSCLSLSIQSVYLQLAPLICTSVISTLRLFARRAFSPISVYAMSMAVNFTYKHQPHMHNLAISTHSLGPSTMTYFGYKQLG